MSKTIKNTGHNLLMVFWSINNANSGKLISIGNGKLLRINTDKNTIEYSSSGGSIWTTRCSSKSYGTFHDLIIYDGELLACTSKGVYKSTSGDGSVWIARCTSSSYGEFYSLMDNGKELLANTSKGVYASSTHGSIWTKRH